jgi:hypothetical protein
MPPPPSPVTGVLTALVMSVPTPASNIPVPAAISVPVSVWKATAPIAALRPKLGIANMAAAAISNPPTMIPMKREMGHLQ